MSGYSKTKLGKKLGLKNNYKALFVNKPQHYFDLFEDFPDDIDIKSSGQENSLDFIHLFVKSLEEFEDRIHHIKPLLKKDGLIWVSWPKKSSKITSDINRDLIREYILNNVGLVDVKVCSIDEDWSALKFVYRLSDR